MNASSHEHSKKGLVSNKPETDCLSLKPPLKISKSVSQSLQIPLKNDQPMDMSLVECHRYVIYVPPL